MEETEGERDCKTNRFIRTKSLQVALGSYLDYTKTIPSGVKKN